MPFTATDFRITSGASFRLKDHATELKNGPDKADLKAMVAKDRARISELQELLYAEGQRALLLIFQAMDAAGKDSCMAHLLTGVNPQGCLVKSFKQPSKEELAHDFLWRHTNALPGAGIIGVHNRSHYEEVLVVKVHPEYLKVRPSNKVDAPSDATAAFWEKRYAAIRAWEQEATEGNITVMKFFLNMGKKEQKKRFLERIEDPTKNWKFSIGDVKERAHFDAYMAAYEEAIRATATDAAPWFVVPADEQWESRAIVAQLVREQLEAMKPTLPVLSAKAKEELAVAKKMLEAE
jgi:PPK2 family polyphosphate:nucleotide phosphotransferase